MGYIVELQTTQTHAVRTLIDTLNSLLTDVNLNFYPYYINDNDESESSSDSSSGDEYEESDNEEKDNSKLNINVNDILLGKNDSVDKKIGGLRIKEVNKTSSILVHCKLDADKFDHYEYKYHKKKLTIGINLANLLKALKCMTNFDTMTWAIDDEDINKLIVILQNIERKEKKIFKLNLMDLDDEKYEVDPVKFPFYAIMPSTEFHKYCKDMSTVSEKMDIKCTSDHLFFNGLGSIGDFQFSLGESVGGLTIGVNTEDKNEIVQGLFELKYLIIFTKCTSLCGQVTLFLKNDYPLIVKYSVANLGEIKLVLSPSKPKSSY
jgi:proliferating cell nuclear antigen